MKKIFTNLIDNGMTYLVAGFIGYGFAEWFDGSDLDMWIWNNLDRSTYGCMFVAMTIAVGMTVTLFIEDVFVTYIRAKRNKNIDV